MPADNSMLRALSSSGSSDSIERYQWNFLWADLWAVFSSRMSQPGILVSGHSAGPGIGCLQSHGSSGRRFPAAEVRSSSTLRSTPELSAKLVAKRSGTGDVTSDSRAQTRTRPLPQPLQTPIPHQDTHQGQDAQGSYREGENVAAEGGRAERSPVVPSVPLSSSVSDRPCKVRGLRRQALQIPNVEAEKNVMVNVHGCHNHGSPCSPTRRASRG